MKGQEPKNVLSEKTLVPISLILALMVGVIRVESTSFKANANESKIKEMETDYKKISEELRKHGEALARIEGALGSNKSQQQIHKK